MQVRFLFFFLLSFGLSLCKPSGVDDDSFEKGKVMGINKNETLEESSGLVASVTNPGCLWAINDSGHPPQLFLLDSSATTKKVFTLANIRNRDWEDIALGIDPVSHTPILYIGDIGDNSAKYLYKYIYRLKEPSLDDPQDIVNFDTLVIKLSDEPRDTEALMIDPLSNNLYLVSKREKEVKLYEIKNPLVADTLTAQRIAELPLKEIVAGDISPDGKEALIKSYTYVYYFRRKANETLADLLKGEFIKLPYKPEPMGESIAWARDGSGYYTMGENAKRERAKLFFYKRK